MSRFAAALGPLVAVYVLALGRFGPWDFAAGAVLAGSLLVAYRRFVFGRRPAVPPNWLARAVWFVPFAAATLLDVVRGTWAVMLVVVGVRPLGRPGVVAVPVGDRSPTGVAVTALVTTLSPGSVLLEIDRGRRVMLFHYFDAADPDAIRRWHDEFYHRYQRAVFP